MDDIYDQIICPYRDMMIDDAIGNGLGAEEN